MLLKRSFLLSAFALLPLASLFSQQPQATSNQATNTSRWATYKNAAGESYFAVSIQATQDLPAADQVEVAVIVDTSASQTGQVRLESIEVLNELAANLPLNAKVALLASDVETVVLSGGLVDATDSKFETAVARLQKRVPLGTTNLSLALRTALAQFSQSSAQKTIVYIGDGINRNSLLTPEEHRALVDDLVTRQVTVSSLAIGPVVDVANLAAFANNTGGIFLARSEIEESTQAIGRLIGSSVSLPVVWPTKVDGPKALATYFPAKFPPLRLDRDTVVVGLASGEEESGKLVLQGTSAGKPVELSWVIKPEASNPDLAFLPSVIDSAKLDGGINLPALGSAGLRAMSYAMADTATELVKAGQFALKSGDSQSAKRIAEEALKSDPNNAEATSLLNAAQKQLEEIPAGKFMQTSVPGDDPFGTGAAPATGANEDPFGNPAPQESVPAPAVTDAAIPAPATQVPAPSLLPGSEPQPSLLDDTLGASGLLEREEELRRAAAQAITQEVRNQLSEAQKLMKTDPAGVKNALKARLEEIDSAVDLDPALRADLRSRLQNSIRSAAVEEGRYLDRVQRAETIRAQADASQRLLAEVNRTDESIKQLVEQFNYLMDQRKFLEASKDVAPEVSKLAPDTPIENTIRESSSLLANYALLRDVYERREQGLVDAFRGVESAAIPIDEPTIIYPPAEVWQALSARRKERYGAINLAGGAGGSKAEQKINSALKQQTKDIEYQGTALRAVMDELQEEYGIPIRLNTVELGLAGVDPDAPITITLPPVSLRSALRQILSSVENADEGLTYTIRDEVLLITSKEDADNEPQIKVYQVGDLVVTPQMLRMSGGGGMMGGMGGGMGGMGGGMGGMGGGMGGMGGGMGGMGGGMGGMGGMGGGMGGMFIVPDDKAKSGQPSTKAPLPKHRASAETLVDVDSLVARYAKATDEELKKLDNEVAEMIEARVAKGTALLTAKKTAEAQAEFQQVIEVVGGLLSAGYPQAWMYQAMSLSMEACDYPAADIKRLMLSGLDFDGTPNEAVRIAKHFVRKGMKKEALDLLHDVAKVEPYRYDIFALALPLANEIKDTESLKWVCLGVLGKAWPKAQAKLFDEAHLSARATAIRLAQSGRIVESKAFEEAIKSSLMRDIVVRINWTGDADLDIRVREPAGTICSLSEPQSIGGGVLLGDTSSATESAKVGGFSEYYVCSQGFAGQYDILVRRVWGEVTGGKATVEIYTDYGTPDQKLIVKQLDLSEKDSLIQVAVKNGHRREPIAMTQIAQAQKQRLEASRAILGQMAPVEENGSTSTGGAQSYDYPSMQQFRQAAINNGFGFPGGSAVGYMPQITVIPSGANLTVAGVVSADRRYVRIAPTPFFSDIGQVTTFNFVSGATGTSGTGGTGGGFGGGGVGGGGGIL